MFVCNATTPSATPDRRDHNAARLRIGGRVTAGEIGLDTLRVLAPGECGPERDGLADARVAGGC